jgi:hypothetical protein
MDNIDGILGLSTGLAAKGPMLIPSLAEVGVISNPVFAFALTSFDNP